MRKLAIVLILAACQKAAPVAVETVATPQAVLPKGIAIAAEQVAVRAVESGFADANAVQVANCIRLNADNAELLTLADGALHSTTPDELALVTSILNRPTTQACLLENRQVTNS